MWRFSDNGMYAVWPWRFVALKLFQIYPSISSFSIVNSPVMIGRFSSILCAVIAVVMEDSS